VSFAPSPPIGGGLEYVVRVAEDRWSALTVRVGTHHRRAAGALRAIIYRRHGFTPLRHARAALEHVADNSYVTFQFDPLEAGGRTFRVRFVLDDPTGSSLVSVFEEPGHNRSVFARGLGRLGLRLCRSGLKYLVNGSSGAESFRLHPLDASYGTWLAANAPTTREIVRRAAAADALDGPRVSVLVPVWNTPAGVLERCIESVRNQLYPRWELCLVDDASTHPAVREVLWRAAVSDRRIRVRYREGNGGISRASNDALAMATGTHVALLDHDDELAPDALYEVALLLTEHPEADFVYTDEDKIDSEGRRFDPAFKPGWSPELLLGTMYTGHLSVYRAELVRGLGGFRPAYDGSQDYDLALRVADATSAVFHVPKVLYHWRTLPTSAAAGADVKRYALRAQKNAIDDALARAGCGGEAQPTAYPGNWRPARRVRQPAPLVSIVIPTAGRSRTVRGTSVRLLENCISAIAERTEYRSFEFVVVHNGDLAAETMEFLGRRADVRLVAYDRTELNLSEKMNAGVRAARGAFVLLLNDDTEVINPDWLDSMVALAQVPGVGVVGAKLLFENGHYQHVGVVWIDTGPNHAFLGQPPDVLGPGVMNALQHDCIAVTGACLLVAKELYERVGGFDEALPLNYNDMDFCMRVRQAGFRIVVDPFAQLYHYESASKTGTRYKELEQLLGRWGDVVDPYYNANLDRSRPLFQLSVSPTPPDSYQAWHLNHVARRRARYPVPEGAASFSILTSVYDTAPRLLEELAHTVAAQTYPPAEWVLIDNGSRDAATIACLARLASRDRVKLVRVEDNRGIIGGMRVALGAARGDYVLPVDSDDLLTVDALAVLAAHVERHGRPALLYSDEDKCGIDSVQHSPFLKPDFDPVLFMCCCFVAHLCAIERAAALAGGVYEDDAATGCHDWDTFTRLMRRGAEPVHVPEVLYSWRIHQGSTASLETSGKSFTVGSQFHVLSNHVRLRGHADTHDVTTNDLFGHPGMWRLRRKHIAPAPMEVVVAAEETHLELRAAEVRSSTDYPDLRLRPCVAASAEATDGSFESGHPKFVSGERLVDVLREAAARMGAGGLVAFVSDKANLVEADWAWEALGLLEFHDAVLAGGRVLDRQGRVLWAGGFFGFGGFLGSPDADRPASDSGYHGGAFCQRSADGVSPLFWVARGGFVADALRALDRQTSPARVAGALALEAHRQHLRVVVSPFLTVRATSDEVGWQHAQPLPPDAGTEAPAQSRYYHRLLSQKPGRGYQIAELSRFPGGGTA